MSRYRWILCLCLITGCLAGPGATRCPAETEPTEPDPRMEWFHQAKFGMFIHWGVYAVPAGEWKEKTGHGEWIQLTGNIPNREYAQFVRQFNPVRFDAREWARIAREAGMKYMVITAKHHDGFCMYDSAFTDYDIVEAAPYGKDPMKDLAKACAEEGLTFCFYYSIADWHHPEMPAPYGQRGFHGDPNPNADVSVYADYMRNQVRELLTNYGPIGILWFDGGGSFRGVDRAKLNKGEELVAMIKSVQPKCLINNRLGVGEDYGTPEQHIPGTIQQQAFEVCMTLNRHWGYNKNDQDWKSPTTVIRNLADIAHKGGNYLLNVGPTAEGLIPEASINILKEVGRWMSVNGESIYETTGSLFKDLPAWGRITIREKVMYVHVFDAPADGAIRLAGLMSDPKTVSLLADPGKRLVTERDGPDLVVTLPDQLPDPINSIVKMEFDRVPEVVNAVRPSTDGSYLLKAAKATIHGTKAFYQDEKARHPDNIGGWLEPEDWVEWELFVTQPGTFDVRLVMASPSDTARFVVGVGEQRLDGKAVRTGSYETFDAVDLGRVRIETSGVVSCSVKPDPDQWSPINLRSVTLIRVKE